MLSRAEFMKTCLDHCPNCGEEGPAVDDEDFVRRVVIKYCYCPCCGQRWRENYTLTGVEYLNDDGEDMTDEEIANFTSLDDDDDKEDYTEDSVAWCSTPGCGVDLNENNYKLHWVDEWGQPYCDECAKFTKGHDGREDEE